MILIESKQGVSTSSRLNKIRLLTLYAGTWEGAQSFSFLTLHIQ